MTRHRYEALDSLRGVAALTVLIAHLSAYGLMSNPELWAVVKWTPLRVLWGGHQAVILFFVMSGFALFLMLENKRMSARGIGAYLSSRIVRLYPTYVASLLFTGAVIYNTDPIGVDLGQMAVTGHLLMVGVFDYNAINPPIWSIIHEMRISLIFPILAALMLRWPLAVVGVTMGTSIGLAVVLWTGIWPADVFDAPIWFSLASTLHYVTAFASGAAVALHRDRLLRVVSGMPRSRTFGWSLVCLGLYMYPFDNPWNSGQRFAGDMVIIFGAAGLILLAIQHGHLLSGSALNYLGKISFSLYLIHFSCIALAKSLVGTDNSPLLWLTAIVLSLAAAHLLFVAVEQPTRRASRWIRVAIEGKSATRIAAQTPHKTLENASSGV